MTFYSNVAPFVRLSEQEIATHNGGCTAESAAA
jgi:hypothetical protein